MDNAKLIELILNTGVAAVATLVAAFAGAWWAFRLADNHAKRKTVEDQVAAANRALFVLIRQFNSLANLKQKLLDPVRNDLDRHLKMRASFPLDYSHWRVHFDSLSYLLETECRNVLFDLMVVEERFHAAIQTLNERSALHLHVVQPRFDAAGIMSDRDYPLTDLEHVLGPRITALIRQGTDETFSHIDNTCESMAKIGELLPTMLKTIFPNNRFISFGMQIKPA